MVLYTNCANHAPVAKFGHAPGINSLYRLTIGKHSNINTSKASRWILIKLSTQHHWAVEKIVYCWQIGLELWLTWQHIRFNGKIENNLLLKHRAHSFDIWYVAMAKWSVLYIHFANYAPGSILATPVVGSLHRLLWENIQTTVSPKTVSGP